MNVLLWVLQVVLALLYLAGGAYKTFSFDEVAKQMTALPRGGWAALGGLDPTRRGGARAGDPGPRRGVRAVLVEAGRDQSPGLGRRDGSAGGVCSLRPVRAQAAGRVGWEA